MSRLSLLGAGAVIEFAYLCFYFLDESPTEVGVFIGVNFLAFILLSILWWKSRTAPLDPAAAGLIIGFAILFRLTLIFHPPVGSDDLYRYLWDGRVGAHGINPYRYAPADSALAGLHTALVPSKVNFPHMRTIYPPLAQGMFALSNVLFGESPSGLKFLLTLCDLGTIAILFFLFRCHPRHLLLYAWSPLPVMYVALDGHVDALGIPFLLLAVALMQRGRTLAGAFSLGLGGLAKLYPLYVVPFLFGTEKGWRRLVVLLTPVAVFGVVCFAFWEPTGGLLDSFMMYNSIFEFNGSLFSILYEMLKSNERAHLICALLFAIWMVLLMFLKRSLLEKIFLAFLGFLLLSPVVQPWYLLWLAALLPLRWSLAAFVFLGLSNISNVVVYQYRSTGVWLDNPMLLAVEYVPVYVLLVREIVRGNFSHGATETKVA
jgi:hypothetical protein